MYFSIYMAGYFSSLTSDSYVIWFIEDQPGAILVVSCYLTNALMTSTNMSPRLL